MKQEEENWNEEQNIPFPAYGSILTTLGFLPLRTSEDSEDYKLCKDLWNLLEGEDNGGVSVDNLLRMLTVIRGIDVMSEHDASFNSTLDGYLSRYLAFDSTGLV